MSLTPFTLNLAPCTFHILFYTLSHVFDLLRRQLREHRQRQQALGGALGDGKVALLEAQVGVGFLKVQRQRVVQAGANALFGQNTSAARRGRPPE